MFSVFRFDGWGLKAFLLTFRNPCRLDTLDCLAVKGRKCIIREGVYMVLGWMHFSTFVLNFIPLKVVLFISLLDFKLVMYIFLMVRLYKLKD